MTFFQITLIATFFVAIYCLSMRIKGGPLFVLIGFSIRAGLAIIDDGNYVLPWSGSDSVVFFMKVNKFVATRADLVLFAPPLSSSSMFPWVMSWPARFFGSEYLFLVFINVLLGTLNILQVRRLADTVLNAKQAKIATWIFVFFPVSAVLSAVFIRETVIATFMLLAFTQFALAIKSGKVEHIALASIAVFCAALFHGALIVCLTLLPVGYYFANVVKSKKAERNAASPTRLIVFSLLLFGAILGFGPKLSKIGSLEDIDNLVESRAEREEKRNVARNSDYPLWLSKNIYRPDIAAARYIYFMFAPFPWSWRGAADIAGSALGLANMYAFYIVWKNRKVLSVIPVAFAFSVMLTTLMFSTGVNNVGTAIRHRNKVLPALLCAGIAGHFAHKNKSALRRVHNRRPIPVP